jgi:2-dehydro-3-deoxygalactonokinase
LGRACFSVRILELFSSTNANQRANFLLGAVLATDLTALKNSSALQWSPDTPIVITGRRIMRQALQTLVRDDSFFQGAIMEIDDRLTEDMAAIGAMAIARERGIFP